MLDLCTGTGCIPLLLHSIVSQRFPHLQFLGVDNAPPAIRLANKNKRHNIKLGHLQPSAAAQIHFKRGDILAPQRSTPAAHSATDTWDTWADREWDILISNPPYISPHSFNTTTSKSVRDWEPKNALVPLLDANGARRDPLLGTADDEDVSKGDAFYPRLLEIASRVSAKIVLFEVADLAQAIRVAGMVVRGGQWDGLEIWRDWPGQGGKIKGEVELAVEGRHVDVVGEGNGRAVFAWTKEGGLMLGRREE